jgi:hypothetical protein
MGDKRNACRVLLVETLEDPCADWRKVLKWIFKKLVGRAWN